MRLAAALNLLKAWLLTAPTTALRQAALDGDSELLRAAERLYKKDDDSQPAP